MANWFAGLPQKSSAQRAAKWGGIACLFQSARVTVGNFAMVSSADKPLDHAIVWFIGQSLLPAFVAVAGVRLWRHQGWVWGSFAAFFVAADLAAATFALGATKAAYAGITANVPSAALAAEVALFTGFAMKVGLIILIINGVRGALALKKVDYSNDLQGVFS